MGAERSGANFAEPCLAGIIPIPPLNPRSGIKLELGMRTSVRLRGAIAPMGAERSGANFAELAEGEIIPPPARRRRGHAGTRVLPGNCALADDATRVEWEI
jgi:hypothetical protein